MNLQTVTRDLKAAMLKINNGTAARTSFQDTQSYAIFLFSEWRIELTNYLNWTNDFDKTLKLCCFFLFCFL